LIFPVNINLDVSRCRELESECHSVREGLKKAMRADHTSGVKRTSNLIF